MQTSAETCECGGQILFTPDTGESICGSCGVVSDDPMINYGREWRSYTQREYETRARAGSPLSPSISDRGLATTMGAVGRDAFGRKLKTEEKVKMMRLKRWNVRSRVDSSADRNLAQSMTFLNGFCEKLNIPKATQDEAAVIYRRALKAGLVRGRSIEQITAASLYAAIRQHRIQRTIKEVTAATRYPRKDISRCYRLLLKELKIKPPIPDAKIHVSKIAGKLGLSVQLQNQAVDMLREAKAKRITAGLDPVGLACAALYIVCRQNGESPTQNMIADAGGITEVTIRNRYKGLREGLNLVI